MGTTNLTDRRWNTYKSISQLIFFFSFHKWSAKKRILSFCTQANFVPLSLNLFYQQLITLVGFLLIRVLQHIGYHFVTKTGTFVDTRASQAP